jgi:hypothetical protein
MAKYRLSSELTDGYANLLLVMDYLIEKENIIMKADQAKKKEEKKIIAISCQVLKIRLVFLKRYT